jgi:hypothetical protein
MKTINPNTPLGRIISLDSCTDSFNGTYGFNSTAVDILVDEFCNTNDGDVNVGV